MTDEERQNIATISEFFAAWNERNASKVASFFAENARWSVGPIGKAPEFKSPNFTGLIEAASHINLTVAPDSIWARGSVVALELKDDIVLPDKKIGGTFVVIFTLVERKIVDFIEFFK